MKSRASRAVRHAACERLARPIVAPHARVAPRNGKPIMGDVNVIVPPPKPERLELLKLSPDDIAKVVAARAEDYAADMARERAAMERRRLAKIERVQS